jgi:hypothetical protein
MTRQVFRPRRSGALISSVHPGRHDDPAAPLNLMFPLGFNMMWCTT